MPLRTRSRLFVGLMAAGFLLSASTAFAQTGGNAANQAGQVAAAANLLSTTPLPIIVAQIISAVIGTLGIVLVCLIIFAGFRYMTAGGDVKKTDQAKAIIKNAIIGLAIVLSAFIITQFVLNELENIFNPSQSTVETPALKYGEPSLSALDGKVVQDVYPTPGASGVARNTSIMITFVNQITPGNLISGATINADGSAEGGLNTSAITITPTDKTDTTDPAFPNAGNTNTANVSMTADGHTFVIKPVSPQYLGNAATPTGYTVTILKDLTDAKSGSAVSTQGFSWSFQVSTVIDLTPPTVVSVTPASCTGSNCGSNGVAPNSVVEITFSKAMNPTTVSGTSPSFNFIHVDQLTPTPSAGTNPLAGTYVVGNGYTTVDFTTNNACGKDACGDIIYCLPFGATLSVTAKSATVVTTDPTTIPQATFGTGITDADGNALDGTGKWTPTTPKIWNQTADYYDYDTANPWTFTTGATLDSRSPVMLNITPKIDQGSVSSALSTPVGFTFNMPLMASSVTNSSVMLWPDPYYAMWFLGQTEDLNAEGNVISTLSNTCSSGAVSTIGDACTSNTDCGTSGICDTTISQKCTAGTISTVGNTCNTNTDCGTSSSPTCDLADKTIASSEALVDHPTLIPVSNTGVGYDYDPNATQAVRGYNQFCYYPANGPTSQNVSTQAPLQGSLPLPPSTTSNCASDPTPACCHGSGQSYPCYQKNTAAGASGPAALPLSP